MSEVLQREHLAPTGPDADPAQPDQWTVLCVDDESNIRSALRRTLRAPGQRILLAESGAQALEILEREPVDVVISDMRMPGMDGAVLLAAVFARWPQTIRILLTGYADTSTTLAAVNQGQIFRYLTKPWDEHDLRSTVAQALERLQLARDKTRLEALTHEQNEALKEINATLERRVEERTADLALAHERLKRDYMNSIKAFSNLIEMRGGHLAGHGRRVAALARKVGETMAVSADDAQSLFVASILHDIGLIGLPDAVLEQPIGKLGADALSSYRKHPGTGEEALMALDGMQDVGRLIRHHHEHFDGSGFPDGLKGAEIPLGARIIAVVDAFDELKSGHLGESGMRVEDARTLIRHGRGTRFDPEVVDTFLHLTEPERPRQAPPPRELASESLEPGMVLAADVLSPDRLVLLGADLVLSADLIRRLRIYEQQKGVRLHVVVRPQGANQ